MSDETTNRFFTYRNARRVILYCATCKVELNRQPRWERLLGRGEISDVVRSEPCGHIIAFRRSGTIRPPRKPT